jgi:hypothetical protein
MAQTNISNTRDGNGNLVRRSVPINNTPPMINSTHPTSSAKPVPDRRRCFPYAWAPKMKTRRREPAGLGLAQSSNSGDRSSPRFATERPRLRSCS